MQVVKRDGRLMEFNKERIVNAIVKAMKQTSEGIDEELAKKIACGIEKQLENRDEVSVYEIQDLVEKKLMVSSRKEVATAYITYRYTRDIARRSKTKNVFLDIITLKTDSLKLNGSYENIDEMMNQFAAESIKPYVDTMLLSKEVRDTEKAGYINIRNKSYYPTKAVRTFQIPLSHESKILKECRNVECAVIKILSLVYQLSGEVCETIYVSPPDSILNSFFKKNFEEEIQNIKEAFTIDNEEALKSFSKLAEKQAQMRINNSLKFLLEGLSLFSKSVIFLDGEVNYSNDGSGVVNATQVNLPQIAFEAINYTKDTNVGPMPILKTNEDELIEGVFFNHLEKCIDIALKSMIERFQFQSTGLKSQFPVLMSGLWRGSEELKENDTLEGVLKNGTLELEIAGLNKAISMLKECDEKIAQTFKSKVVSTINARLNAFSKEYHLNFTWKETKDNDEYGG